ncbi:hypothetical protein DXG01_002323 [Tephrocybe rancida]|nr:hypothetical protein DXG01_002323 [Tephrocybe rancida]
MHAPRGPALWSSLGYRESSQGGRKGDRPGPVEAAILSKRFEKREEVKEEEENAKETGTTEDMDGFSRRESDARTQSTTTQAHGHFLSLWYVRCQAPSETEAQGAELVRGGKVYAAGSEDMDTLTPSAPILFRHLIFSKAKKITHQEDQPPSRT